MNARSFFLSLFALLAACAPAQAQTQTRLCKWDGEMSVHVMYETPRLKFEKIPPSAREKFKALPKEDPQWPSVVVFQPTLGVSAPFIGEGKEPCQKVGAIQVLHGYKEVYIALDPSVANLPCVRETLWRHEVGHIKAHKKYLHGLEGALRARLAEQMAKGEILYSADPVRAQRELERKLAQSVKALWEKEDETNKKAQQALDIPAEIELIKQACDGALSRSFDGKVETDSKL